MNRLSLLVAAGALATTFSGCYVDRTPTMTLEERMMASDKEIAEYEAKKKAWAGSRNESDASPGMEPSKPVAEIASQVPFSSRRFIEFSGRKFMTRTWAGAGVVNLEVWTQASSGGWWNLVSAKFESPGTLRLVSDDKSGVVTLLSKSAESGAETEVFRYDLGSAAR